MKLLKELDEVDSSANIFGSTFDKVSKVKWGISCCYWHFGGNKDAKSARKTKEIYFKTQQIDPNTGFETLKRQL